LGAGGRGFESRYPDKEKGSSLFLQVFRGVAQSG
jgi:hypothetical protein